MDRDKPPVTNAMLFDPPERQVRALAVFPKLGELTARYRPWRKVRTIARDIGLDPVEAWTAIKLQRFYSSTTQLPLQQANGKNFYLVHNEHLLEAVHRVDRATGGGDAAVLESPSGVLADDAHRSRIRIRTLMDEAAESSMIEGAATTRKEAVEMLRSSRSPRSKGELMVVNNYRAMQYVKEHIKEPLSATMLLRLQAIVTNGTLDREDEAGRFRWASENVIVEDRRTNEVVYVPPPAEGLASRIGRLCEFANAEHVGEGFIHPIVKASILHFMIGYEHPFTDGNGRTARAVFYWYALRHGYKIFEYIPISERIRDGFARYADAYMDCELDDGDLTYFVLYKLDIIRQSLDVLAKVLEQEEGKIKRSAELLKISGSLNLRQRLILEHALRHPQQRYTVKSHANSNGITLNTARTDLEKLVSLRLMKSDKDGRELLYFASPALPERLAKAMHKKA